MFFFLDAIGMKTLRESDTIFQIVYDMVLDSRKKVPLHIGISQNIHDKCRSNVDSNFQQIGIMYLPR